MSTLGIFTVGILVATILDLVLAIPIAAYLRLRISQTVACAVPLKELWWISFVSLLCATSLQAVLSLFPIAGILGLFAVPWLLFRVLQDNLKRVLEGTEAARKARGFASEVMLLYILVSVVALAVLLMKH